MRRIASSLIVAGVLAVGSAASAEPKTWEYGGGGSWPLVEAPATQPGAVDNPTLDQAERLVEAGKGEQAEDLVLAWIKTHRTAPDRDRGLFLLARAYYLEGDRIRSYYQFDELLDTYPESRFFYPSLEQQYQIADDFLRGAKRRFIGLKIISATDEAIDMLFRVQERSPGSPLAERAMLRTADYYYNTGQFDLSADVYTAYLRSYPRSPQLPRVRLRRAFSSYAQFRGVLHEATPLIEARTQLEDIKVRYPEMAAEENVQQFIDRINATLARKLLATASYWRRTGFDRSAAYTYQQLIESYPDAAEAETARKELASLPAAARAVPKPPTTSPFEPTTRTVTGPEGPPAPPKPRPQAEIPPAAVPERP